MRRTTLALTVTAALLAATALAALVAVPAAGTWLDSRHQQTSAFDTGAAAKASRASVPRWLPDDARSVRYAMRTTGGERLLKATLPDGAPPAPCTAAPGTAAKAPAIGTDWFPADARDRAAVRCGAYYAYTDGDTLYAWQDNADWIRDGAN
ncbi:hypothetical protein GCM10010371_15420 [Streptomyces subrutilus]|uniref:Secreted protein n=1 Tax=Streptomyces subrutilus TaxID=36818 RepID=A0A5P2UG82_9ACTN|nr:hypothetical protein [Streptomyces subrutilus]QEU78018.1 hypothetical protein CP968_06755 [Streptomyces subrutilus]GGZ56791.1 hypothetical protein GCM10010371_15420 [Streptomyces subrutilus]